MADEVIKYESPRRVVHNNATVLETTATNGVTCAWSGTVLNPRGPINFSWKFDWNDLKNKGVCGLSGHIIVKPPQGYNYINEMKIDVNLTKSGQTIDQVVQTVNNNFAYSIIFEYCLIPYYAPTEEISYDEMFLPSDQNDAILVVEDKKLHVSKAFLSYHSDYFRALFSSNYKEGQMDEIPIGEIPVKDIGLLLSAIYPINAFPNDETVEKLLELGDRFMMPSVIHKVEHHLLTQSKIENEKMIWMADKYEMPKLLEKMISQIDTLEKVKKLEQSKGFPDFSDSTNAKLFMRILKII